MENDNKKCDKYEAFFVFQDEESFRKHLKECPDCAKEHEKYMRVSELVKEVAPAYKEYVKRKNSSVVKRIACCFLMFLGFSVMTGYKMYNDYTMSQYDLSNDYTYFEDTGMPVDDYGFIEF